MDLDKNLRGMDANTQSALEEERARRQKVWLSTDSTKQCSVSQGMYLQCGGRTQQDALLNNFCMKWCLKLWSCFSQAEEQLREKVQEFIELQNKYDGERTDLMVKWVTDYTYLSETLITRKNSVMVFRPEEAKKMRDF